MAALSQQLSVLGVLKSQQPAPASPAASALLRDRRVRDHLHVGAALGRRERQDDPLDDLGAALHGAGTLPDVGKFSVKFRSFSAVSAPIFATKYAFCSILQNLPDYLAEIFEIWQNFANLKFYNICKLFAEFSQKMLIFQTDFLLKF